MAFLGGRSDFNLQECWGGPGCAHPPATGILGHSGDTRPRGLRREAGGQIRTYPPV